MLLFAAFISLLTLVYGWCVVAVFHVKLPVFTPIQQCRTRISLGPPLSPPAAQLILVGSALCGP